MNSIGNNILSIDDLSDGDVSRLFFSARAMRDARASLYKQFNDAVLMTAFFEPSTRTRLSFEMAAHKLGVRISSFQRPSSSMEKGESEHETIINLLALKPDIFVIRRSLPFESPIPYKTTTAIINGGDGINEHPTQALLDCFTLLEHFQCDNLYGKRILIMGDIAHSRVAHSNIKLMSRLSAEIVVLAPPNFQMPLPSHYPQFTRFDEIDGSGIDAVICLRVQKERLHEVHHFNEREFSEGFGLFAHRFARLSKSCVVLHPGPMNVGVEIGEEVANHPRSLINEQVKNGVLVRAALIKHCLSSWE